MQQMHEKNPDGIVCVEGEKRDTPAHRRVPQDWQGTDTVTGERIRPPVPDDYQDNINRHARINTRCPSCGYQTIIIGAGRLLVCAFLGCRDPLAINEAADVAKEHAALVAERDEFARALQSVGITEDRGAMRLRWVFRLGDIEVSSSGGTPAQRLAGLLTQVRFVIDAYARKAAARS